jgi:hypothetical protein
VYDFKHCPAFQSLNFLLKSNGRLEETPMPKHRRRNLYDEDASDRSAAAAIPAPFRSRCFE